MNQLKFYFWLFIYELWNKKWIFLPLFWLLSIFAIFIVFLIPDQYKTEAGIYIDTDKLLARVLKNTADVINDDAQSQAQKVSQMIYSTSSLRKVLRSLSPDNYNLSTPEETLKLKEMSKNLKFTAYNSSSKDYYNISYVHSDPVIAYKTLKKILDLFIETNIRQMSSKNDRALAVSEDSLKIHQRELAQAQAEIAEFKQQNHDLVSPTPVLLSELHRLNELIRTYPTQKSLLQSKLTNLSALLAETSRRTGDSRTKVTSASCNYSQIEQQLVSAKSRGLTALHPDVVYYTELLKRQKNACSKANNSKIIVKKGHLNSTYIQLSEQVLLIKSDLNNLKNDYKNAKKRVVEISDILNKRPIITEKLRILESRLEKANTDYKSATSNNDILKGTIDLSQKSGLISYEVIEEVQMPIFPIKPNRLMLFIGAFLGSFIAAASYIIIKFILERRISTISHAREIFDLPVLGSITYIDKINTKPNIFDIVIWIMGFTSLIALYYILIQITIFSPIKSNLGSLMILINKILQLSL